MQAGGAPRRVTLGAHGEPTGDRARKGADAVAASPPDRPTVADLAVTP